mgnify:CR=1 FL=1
MEKTTDSKMFSESPKQNGRKLLRLWLTVLGIHLISLLLGFAIFLIVFGVQLIFRRIIITWLPARKWFAKTFAVTITEYGASNVSSKYASFLSKFHFFMALAHAIVGLYMIATGLNIFLRDGFLGQNFIYLIFFR